MATREAAAARIAWVTGRSSRRRDTPATISGNATSVYSYGMQIAELTEHGWVVVPYDAGPTATTKRHIRAAQLELLGFIPGKPAGPIVSLTAWRNRR